MSDLANEVAKSDTDLTAFHGYVGDLLRRGNTDVSPEDALDLWRVEHPCPDEFEETVAALREALDDMEAGDEGIPLEDFDADFRARHNLPPRK